MKIAFYAPLKSPSHPVPSGDRAMARLLMRALQLAGHQVEVISHLRSFHRQPQEFAALRGEAAAERQRLEQQIEPQDRPDLWLTYHVYYKAPDLIGPPLSQLWNIPYLTLEASYARKRDIGGWREQQRFVADAVRQAAANIWFTKRDLEGLRDVAPAAVFEHLPPFIDPSPFAAPVATDNPQRLVTVAMMRDGDKLASYHFLAAALTLIASRPWTLSIIGDGPQREAVRAMFAGFARDRIQWLGELDARQIAARLGEGGIYLWPGIGEAYGIAYLEAQAAGLPVVALATAGVPAVVESGRTGLLTVEGDIASYAAAIGQMLDEPARAQQFGKAARAFVHGQRSLDQAAQRLHDVISEAAKKDRQSA